MNKIIWALAIIIIIGAAAWLYTSRNNNAANAPAYQSETTPSGEGTSAPSADKTTLPANTESRSGNVKEFTVNGKNFSFSPSTINVRMGDKVKIIFKSDNGFHDLRIEGYDVGTSKVQTGEETSFEFTADKAGSFEYYCSVGSHRVNGMVGTLVVS